MFGVPTSPDVAESIKAKQAGLTASLPVSGRKPISFLNPSEQLSDALPAASLRRLGQLKDKPGSFTATYRYWAKSEVG